jgi:CPA2 family monovalent cation:H+ antiporter-2
MMEISTSDAEVTARAHLHAAVDHLESLGATLVVSGEREIAQRMLDQARRGAAPAGAS